LKPNYGKQKQITRRKKIGRLHNGWRIGHQVVRYNPMDVNKIAGNNARYSICLQSCWHP